MHLLRTALQMKLSSGHALRAASCSRSGKGRVGLLLMCSSRRVCS